MITRLRRWTGVVGQASLPTGDHVSLEATVANLAQDPYQREYDEFSAWNTIGPSAGVVSQVGIIAKAPLTLVDRIDFWATTATTVTINLTRQATAAGIALTVCAYNEGQPTGYPGAGRTTSVNTQLAVNGAGTGIIIAEFVSVPANTTQTWTPPYPLQLFPAPVGVGPGGIIGDNLAVVGVTVNVAIAATIYWREWPNFKF
jgi:hypothetical protein